MAPSSYTAVLTAVAALVLGACGGSGGNPSAGEKSPDVQVEEPAKDLPEITTTVASTTTVPAPKTGDRESPIPIGSEATFSNGWKVKIVGSTPNGTAAIRAANQFNDPPPPGQQFYIVRIAATYVGEGSASPFLELKFSGLDSRNTAIEEGCGVAPEDFDVTKEVFAGGTLTGNLCFPVPSANADSLVMYVDAGGFDSERSFFAVR